MILSQVEEFAVSSGGPAITNLKIRTMQAICKIATDSKVDRHMESLVTDMQATQNEMKARDTAAARLRRQVELLEKRSQRCPESKNKNDDLIATLEDREFKILDMPEADVNYPETFVYTPAPRRHFTSRSPSLASVSYSRSPSGVSDRSSMGPSSPPTSLNTECEDFSDNSNPFSAYNPEWDNRDRTENTQTSGETNNITNSQQSDSTTTNSQHPDNATIAASASMTSVSNSQHLPSGSSLLARRRSSRVSRGRHSHRLDI